MANEARPIHHFDAEERDQFIPVRKIDILNALIASGRLAGEQQENFGRFCQLLGASFHYEFFETLEALRDDYYYFNPEMDPNGGFDAETLERARADLGEKLAVVLKNANYVPVPLEEVTQTPTGGRFVRVAVDTPMDDYREVTFFRRGHHQEPTVVRRWFGLRSETQKSWVYDNVLLTVVIKNDAELSKRQRKRFEKSQFRPGSILIKYFRNIAPGDLKMLLPRVRVVMSLFDKMTIAVPALAQSLGDKNDTVVELSAITLGNLKTAPEIAVPAMTNHLRTPRMPAQWWILRALGEFGEAARPAVPTLLPFLTDHDPRWREAAEEALRKIAPELLTTNSEPQDAKP
jgi:hypothetical protein